MFVCVCFFFFFFFFTRRPFYFHVHGWKSYYKGVQLFKKKKKKKKKKTKWHFIPTICPRCLSRLVINTAQYCRWHYKCGTSPWDENETGLHQVLLIRRGGDGGGSVKLNHFWHSVHSSRSNNNCGRWLNRVCMKGLWSEHSHLNWIDLIHQSDVFNGIFLSDCSCRGATRFILSRGPRASHRCFVYTGLEYILCVFFWGEKGRRLLVFPFLHYPRCSGGFK